MHFDLVDNHIQKPDSLLGFLGKGSGIFIGPVLKEQVGSGLDGGASSNTCTFSVQTVKTRFKFQRIHQMVNCSFFSPR